MGDEPLSLLQARESLIPRSTKWTKTAETPKRGTRRVHGDDNIHHVWGPGL